MRSREPTCMFVSPTSMMHRILVASHTQTSELSLLLFRTVLSKKSYQDQFTVPRLGVGKYEYTRASFELVGNFAIPE